MQVVDSKAGAVIGILKFFKLPERSRGRDFFMSMCLVDESQSLYGLSCVLFNPVKDQLPVATRPGEVVLLKGLSISLYQDNLQGLGHDSTLVGIFSADPADPVPATIGEFYRLRSEERTRIQQLREWAASHPPGLLNSKLEQLSLNNYCNVMCLVVRVGTDQGGATRLTVYDGTLLKKPTKSWIGPEIFVSHDPGLEEMYEGFTSTVRVAQGLSVQVTAGDVVELVNICMVKSAVVADEVELVLEERPECLGSVTVLPKDPVADQFRNELPKPAKPPGAVRSSQPTPRLSTVLDFGPDEQPSTVTLAALNEAAVGSVHMVEAKVMGMNPAIIDNEFEMLCQLRCSSCRTRYLTPQPDNPEREDLMTVGDTCICCNEEDTSESRLLRFMYCFMLIVSDHTAQTEVTVSNEKAEHFFSELKLVPGNLYFDQESRTSHWELLCALSGSDTTPIYDASKPSSNGAVLRLGLLVYTSVSGNRRYMVTNTLLCST